MTRAEAIEILKDVITHKSWRYGDYEALEIVIKALEEPDWIPVKEKLPDEKGEYIVTYHPCYWDNVEEENKVGIDTFRGKTTWAKKKYQRVTAWMPLPEEYKGE